MQVKTKDEAYANLVEELSPGAYRAYKNCLDSSEVGVKFLMDTRPTMQNLQVQVGFDDGSSDSTARLVWNSPSEPNISCNWNDRDGNPPEDRGRVAPIPNNESRQLHCSREDPGADPSRNPDQVAISREDAGDARGFVVSWSKFNKNGTEIETLQQITRKFNNQVRALEKRADALDTRINALLNRQWHDVTALRSKDICYRNETGFPVEVAITTGATSSEARAGRNVCFLELFVGGTRLIHSWINIGGKENKLCVITATIPPNTNYVIDADYEDHKPGQVIQWSELRTSDHVSEESCD